VLVFSPTLFCGPVVYKGAWYTLVYHFGAICILLHFYFICCNGI